MDRTPNDDPSEDLPNETGSRSQLLGIPARFEIRERIGSGGYGSVYSVLDRKTNRLLALKRLERVEPQAIFRFKQEFRTLCQHPHPRLVRLHDIFQHEDRYCLTMDLIEGVRFDSWVHALAADERKKDVTLDTDDPEPSTDEQSTDEQSTDESRPSGSRGSDDHPTATQGETNSHRRPPFDEERLRSALKQLVEGVLELHSIGVLHRDLKPSNVLVDARGALTILDFGIASTLDQAQLREGRPLGTPAYMSPEQARGGALSTASDWYSVGVMLYEALTGTLPFIGTPADMLRARLNRRPRDPSQLVEGLPKDLTTLALDLLERDAFERPPAFAIGARVGLRPSMTARPRHTTDGLFVGRESELSRLRAAFFSATRGSTVVAHVHGQSGLGKTTVVRRFTSHLALNGEATVLEGRCLERESLPFKAWDDLLDALTRHLARLPEMEAARVMPRDARALARLFPALARLPFLKELGGRAASSDVHELRRRAFTALREVFARLSDARPLVLVLDDIQWGDADSAALAEHLLAPPDSPALLLIATYRDEDSTENPLVRSLAARPGTRRPWHNVDVPISPLTDQDAQQLALSLLPEKLRNTERAEIIAREGEKSPLFIGELVRVARLTPSGDGAELTMKRVVRDRIAGFTDRERMVLGTLAASERPLRRADVAEVCSIRPEEASVVLEKLRDEQLVAVTSADDEQRFCLLHDKLRRAVVETLPDEARATYHMRLGRHLESTGADPETVASHYLAAGDRASGFRFTEAAGDAASKRSAFSQALDKYREALKLAAPDQREKILRKLAPTLGRAGLGKEAAETHLIIAGLRGPDAEDQVSQAGEQLLLAGFAKEALETLRPILDRYGLSPPRSKLLAGLRILNSRRTFGRRIEQAVRASTENRRRDADASDLIDVDSSWALANGFSGIDVFLGVYYSTVTVDRALASNDPERIARSLALHSILLALEGAKGQARSKETLDHAVYFAHLSASNHALGWVTGARAILALNRWDLVTCDELCQESIELLRESRELSFREIGTLSVWFWLYPTFLLGKLKMLAEHAPAIAREAEARGDRYTHSTIRSYILPLHHAAQDRLQLARDETDAGLAPWRDEPWTNQHWAHLHSHCFLDLYEGVGQRILERAGSSRPLMKKANQLMIQAIRIDLTYLEGRGHLDAALHRASPTNELASARDCARQLLSENQPLAEVYGRVLEAGCLTRSDVDGGRRLFAELAERFDGGGMPLHAWSSRLRVAELSGPEALDQIREAKKQLEALGALNASCLSWMLVPRVPFSV